MLKKINLFLKEEQQEKHKKYLCALVYFTSKVETYRVKERSLKRQNLIEKNTL